MSADDEVRKELWAAFSDLWLDNEVDQISREYIVRVMIESGLPLDELKAVLRYQVAPVVYKNLYNVFPGGEWAGFDEEWLRNEIIKNTARQKESKLYRWWVRSRPGQKLMTGIIKSDWERIEILYLERARKSENGRAAVSDPSE